MNINYVDKNNKSCRLINVNHHIRDFWRLEMCNTGIIFWSYATITFGHKGRSMLQYNN